MMTDDPCTETYEGVERLVYHTVNRWIMRYGGDFDELVCVANCAFMKAYHGFKLNNAKFSTYLVRVMWTALIDAKHSENRKTGHLVNCCDLQDARGRAVRLEECVHSRVEKFAYDLTDDAKFVLKFVLEAPDDVRIAVAARRSAPEDVRWREEIHKYLTDMGWSYRRILMSFKEIRAAMTA